MTEFVEFLAGTTALEYGNNIDSKRTQNEFIKTGLQKDAINFFTLSLYCYNSLGHGMSTSLNFRFYC